MSTRTPQRIYTAASLEAWFAYAQEDWERFFSPEALALGRQCYKDGLVRGIELSPKSVIVNTKQGREEHYAVLEWEGDRLSARASTQNTLFGQALGVAGFYELEELLVEQCLNVPEKSQDIWPETLLAVDRHSSAKAKAQYPTRRLRVVISARSQGLYLEAFWQAATGQTPALTEREGLKDKKLNLEERGHFIDWLHSARAAGFTFLSYQKAYVLKDFSQAPYFIKQILTKWKRKFDLEVDADVYLLEQPERPLELVAQLDALKADALGLSWDLRLGGKPLSEEEYVQVLKGGEGLTFLKGKGLVRLDANKREHLSEWQGFVGKVLPPYMLFSSTHALADKEELSQSLEVWKQGFLKFSPELAGLPSFLRPYQARGVAFLKHLCTHHCHGLLADEMGLGKTMQILALLSTFEAGSSHLIVCPASVVPVWEQEAARFFPNLRVKTLCKGIDFESEAGPAVWVSSYTQLRRHKHLLKDQAFTCAVLDEGQFIKNPEAKVTQACLQIHARHRFVLTGTPLENRLLDVWTLFRFLMPGLLGARSQFERTFARQDPSTTERLRKQIAPFVLRRKKETVLQELPPKIETDLYCPLTEHQREAYIKLVSAASEVLPQSASTAMKQSGLNIFNLLTRLRQVCCDPALLPDQGSLGFEHSGKLRVLAEKVQELISGGHKVVIFSQFVSFLRRAQNYLKEQCAEAPFFELTGQTVDRSGPVEAFQDAQGPAVIFVSLKAGGTGITLHTAEYVFLLDPWWNPAVEAQAIDRVHRLGQTQHTFIYRLIAPGTLEERIQKMKAEKQDLFAGTFDELKDVSQVLGYYESIGDLIELK